MKTIHHYSAVVFIILTIVGCGKLPEYASEPKISFHSISIIPDVFDYNSLIYKDSVVVRINFEDGEGDLGIANSDLPTSKDNYIMNMEEMTNGVYHKLDYSFNGKFPQLAPANIKSPIDGVLEQGIAIEQAYFPINDTVRFTVYIVDRAGNKSNTITTDPVVVHQQ